MARRIPIFAALLETIPSDVREAQDAQSRELQRKALVEGDWGPLMADLHVQGRAYAQLGIEFADWYALIAALRGPMSDRLPESTAEARELLVSLNAYIDRTMAILGETYIEAKQDLVRRAEDQLQAVLDLFQHAPLGMVLYRWEAPPDRGSFRLLAANAAAGKIREMRLPASQGKRLDELPFEVWPGEVLDRWVEAMTTGTPRTWVRKVDLPDGSVKIWDARCTPLPNGCLAVIKEDVTERRLLENALARHVRELERSNAELDDFAYVASHDLRAPLQDIRSLAGWLAEDLKDGLPDGSARHLRLLAERVRRMERLLEDLLDYSRVGRGQEAAQEFSLREVFDDVAAYVAPPPSFEVRFEGDSPRLRTPRAPLEKVLRNLVGNALKHHDRGAGRVTVQARASGDGWVSVRVGDDGPGIPAEFHSRVFRMFQTLRSRDEVEGSGVGLAIVKKSVEWFGGTISVESAGRGTVFQFTWPTHWEGHAGGPD